MSDERWFAARSRPRVERLRDQPTEGFADLDDVMDWMVARGLITRAERGDDDEGPVYEGWGNPYCAVAGTRNDPWEAPDVE